jgi:histidine triad (HIT) family protein
MNRQDDCIFCRIVQGELPCFRVCEDDTTLAFMDLFPVADGHTLVITKEHFSDIFSADGDSLAAVARCSRRIAQAIGKVMNPDGLGVYQLNRAAAGQTVFHYLMHLVPRTAGDPFTLHSRTRGDDEKLRANAAELAAALD